MSVEEAKFKDSPPIVSTFETSIEEPLDTQGDFPPLLLTSSNFTSPSVISNKMLATKHHHQTNIYPSTTTNNGTNNDMESERIEIQNNQKRTSSETSPPSSLSSTTTSLTSNHSTITTMSSLSCCTTMTSTSTMNPSSESCSNNNEKTSLVSLEKPNDDDDDLPLTIQTKPNHNAKPIMLDEEDDDEELSLFPKSLNKPSMVFQLDSLNIPFEDDDDHDSPSIAMPTTQLTQIHPVGKTFATPLKRFHMRDENLRSDISNVSNIFDEMNDPSIMLQLSQPYDDEDEDNYTKRPIFQLNHDLEPEDDYDMNNISDFESDEAEESEDYDSNIFIQVNTNIKRQVSKVGGDETKPERIGSPSGGTLESVMDDEEDDLSTLSNVIQNSVKRKRLHALRHNSIVSQLVGRNRAFSDAVVRGDMIPKLKLNITREQVLDLTRSATTPPTNEQTMLIEPSFYHRPKSDRVKLLENLGIENSKSSDISSERRVSLIQLYSTPFHKEKARDVASLVIQSLFRGYVVRNKLIKGLVYVEYICTAAFGNISRRRSNKLKEDMQIAGARLFGSCQRNHFSAVKSTALLLQCLIRGHIHRKQHRLNIQTRECHETVVNVFRAISQSRSSRSDLNCAFEELSAIQNFLKSTLLRKSIALKISNMKTSHVFHQTPLEHNIVAECDPHHLLSQETDTEIFTPLEVLPVTPKITTEHVVLFQAISRRYLCRRYYKVEKMKVEKRRYMLTRSQTSIKNTYKSFLELLVGRLDVTKDIDVRILTAVDSGLSIVMKNHTLLNNFIDNIYHLLSSDTRVSFLLSCNSHFMLEQVLAHEEKPA